MEFEWDESKNQSNIAKHDLSFEKAIAIFRNPVLTRIDDREDYGEIREISTGEVNGSVVLVVVHTDRDNITRIISARLASKTERKDYYDYCKNIIA